MRRLLLVSNRAPFCASVGRVVRVATVCVVSYDYQSSNLKEITKLVKDGLSGQLVASIALLLHCDSSRMFICYQDQKFLDVETIQEDTSIQHFFSELASNLVQDNDGLHIFNSPRNTNLAALTGHMYKLLGCPVVLVTDLFGPISQQAVTEKYFFIAELKSLIQTRGSRSISLDGYEKIRSVGKGAFGTAVLYRRVATDSLVVIKEINMLELTASERQMALNEVQVLSSLLHPNIIRYLGSFEQDGMLMIEMEYADGGTLAQLIHRGLQLSEQEVLSMFLQCVAAIRYMHQNNILHRDLKTANVFLTKDRVIKVGDFGISKIMSTKNQAQTVLGTPYYISPEMCEGKQYDNKSDVWALGCILYEMACLHKTFQGSNLPALVNKIMKGTFEPVPKLYSEGFRDLIHHLLQKDPTLRPTASETFDRVKILLDETHSNAIQLTTRKGIRSVLYQVSGSESTFSCVPLALPPTLRITQVAVSNTHYVAVSEEATVFTWGEGKRGQLGHPEAKIWLEKPTPVQALADRQILSIGAGDGFSVFLSESGVLMTCGDGTFGCLGHGDWNNVFTPRPVERLLETEVVQVACGDHHCVSLTSAGQVWMWGRGEGGRLGSGKEQDCSVPTLVSLPHGQTYSVRSVHCGPDCTAVLTHSGAVLACGCNIHNKLGLNTTLCGLSVIHVDKSLNLQLVRCLSSHCIVSLSLAAEHSAALTRTGQVLTMGSNAEAQTGHCAGVPRVVASIEDVVISDVVCGPTYTIVTSVYNALYFWGTRYTGPSTEIVSQPKLMLALYASPTQVTQGESLRVVSVKALWDTALVLVDTTVPVPKGTQLDQGVEYDSIGPIPEWITAELAEAEDPWQG